MVMVAPFFHSRCATTTVVIVVVAVVVLSTNTVCKWLTAPRQRNLLTFSTIPLFVRYGSAFCSAVLIRFICFSPSAS